MNNMQYRVIKEFPKPVSVLSIGSWKTFERLEFEEIVAILEANFAAGVNFIDDCRYGTAIGVPGGLPTTEVLVGRALKVIGAKRSDYFLANKLWWDQYPRRSLREQLMFALQRLDVESVDLLYVDRPDRLAEAQPDFRFDEAELTCKIAEEMAGLVREGIIRAYGFANAKPWALARIIETTDRHKLLAPRVAQTRYSLIEPEARHAAEYERLSASHGLLLTATTTIGGGILTGKYLAVNADEPRRMSTEKAAENASGMAIATRLASLAAQFGLPPSTLAMAYPLLDRRVISVVYGARSAEQVRANMRTIEALRHEVAEAIEALSREFPPQGQIFAEARDEPL